MKKIVIKNQFGDTFSSEEYVDFMLNHRNRCNCDYCPENSRI